MTAGVLLAPSLTASAGAAVTPHTVTLPICLTGEHNSFEFYTWCQGASPAGFRTIAWCQDGQAVLGIEYADGSGSISYADCSGSGQNSTLNTAGDWGILECSDDNGSGTYAGYVDSNGANGGDISWILQNWGALNIATGGTDLCDYSAGAETAISTSGA